VTFARWHRRVLGICLVIFAFELGLFLLVFPWLPNWDLNSIPLHSPFLNRFWMNQYFRGALSGLGLLNIYVAVMEASRQISSVFSRKPKEILK
jgi:hypothetical protein